MGSDQSTIQAVRLSERATHGFRFVAALNRQVLRQGIGVIERLGDEQFVAPPTGLAHSGAGAHFRHIYDYYRCFLRDLGRGRIDYDLRDRDPLFETDRAHAVRCLGALVEHLEQVGDPAQDGEWAHLRSDTPLEARMDAVGDAGEDGHWNRTTLQRELRFLVSHTIHHYALIAVILKVQGFDCGPDFGVAPSTIEYWKQAGS